MKSIIITTGLLGLASAAPQLIAECIKGVKAPPTVTYVKTEILHGNKQHCKRWEVYYKEKEKTARPHCRKWSNDHPRQYALDYILSIAHVDKGECESWQITFPGPNKVVPVCSNVGPACVSKRQAAAEEDYSITEGNAAGNTVSSPSGNKRLMQRDPQYPDEHIPNPFSDWEPPHDWPHPPRPEPYHPEPTDAPYPSHPAVPPYPSEPVSLPHPSSSAAPPKPSSTTSYSSSRSDHTGSPTTSSAAGASSSSISGGTASISAPGSVGSVPPKQLINLIAPLRKKVERIEAQLRQAKGQLRLLDPNNPLAQDTVLPASNFTQSEPSSTSRILPRQFPNGSPPSFSAPPGATIESLCKTIISLKQEFDDAKAQLNVYRAIQKHQDEHPDETEIELDDYYGGGDTQTPERPFQPQDQESGYQGHTVVGATNSSGIIAATRNGTAATGNGTVTNRKMK